MFFRLHRWQRQILRCGVCNARLHVCHGSGLDYFQVPTVRATAFIGLCNLHQLGYERKQDGSDVQLDPCPFSSACGNHIKA
jgi:hypothetical protein